MTPEELKADADEAVRKFSMQITANDQQKSKRPPPEITVVDSTHEELPMVFQSK
jgi:hypothetical protein